MDANVRRNVEWEGWLLCFLFAAVSSQQVSGCFFRKCFDFVVLRCLRRTCFDLCHLKSFVCRVSWSKNRCIFFAVVCRGARIIASSLPSCVVEQESLHLLCRRVSWSKNHCIFFAVVCRGARIVASSLPSCVVEQESLHLLCRRVSWSKNHCIFFAVVCREARIVASSLLSCVGMQETAVFPSLSCAPKGKLPVSGVEGWQNLVKKDGKG